jgi:hypothetical protein
LLTPDGDKVSAFLHPFVTLFTSKHLTVEGSEELMAGMNTLLELVGSPYRFPKKYHTFLEDSSFDKYCSSGISKYAVCKGCHACYPLSPGIENVPTDCTSCMEPVVTVNNKEVKAPVMVYEYNSIAETLARFFRRPGFAESITKWDQRQTIDGLMFDVYDGNIWNSFGSEDGQSVPFVDQSPYNIMLTINIDWFQPFTQSQHSSGGIYLTIQNLPRGERNKKENVICVGLLPGPKEPKNTEINNYLAPLVHELGVMFNDGIVMDVNVGKTVQKERVRAALTLVTCDLPAARKLCGFTSCNSQRACHKCKNYFSSLPQDVYRRDFRNFMTNTWDPRTNESHRLYAGLWNQASTLSAKKKIEQDYGTRYSELLRLSYFDAIRFTVIDPMHNLYLGTAKKMMQLWRSIKVRGILLLTDKHLEQMVVEAKKISLPLGYDSASIVRKMDVGDGFSYMKADEWRVWVLCLSQDLLLGKLPSQLYLHWLKFVEANRLLASPYITVENIEAAHKKLLEFCSEMENHYDASAITSNMHFHAHLKEALLDYGPFYVYW